MTASGSPKPPNVLWICTDQQRWDTIGALGNRHINTPNIDRLVAQGTACTNAYCQSPICTPSRASFLTGCYPSTVHGCSNGNEYWAEAAPLVTKLLADAGYCCGLAGKLHLAGTAGRIEPRPARRRLHRVPLEPRSARPMARGARLPRLGGGARQTSGPHLRRARLPPCGTAPDHLLRRPGDRVHGVRLAPALADERQHIRPALPVRSAAGLPGAVRPGLAAVPRLPPQRPRGAGEADGRGLPDPGARPDGLRRPTQDCRLLRDDRADRPQRRLHAGGPRANRAGRQHPGDLHQRPRRDCSATTGCCSRDAASTRGWCTCR